MDIWVEKTRSNYDQLVKAFYEFGMPTFDMTPENFLDNVDFDVFTFGRQPVAIDIITAIKGLDFGTTYNHAEDVEVEGMVIRLIHYNDLLIAKQAAGRPKDVNDLANLMNRKD